jgi:hypothetical protein
VLQKLWHSVDARQWKTFNVNYPEFTNNPRNLKLVLSTNRMNSFDEMMNPHSTLPVILTYTTLLYCCATREYVTLTTLISVLKQDDVHVLDAYWQESFTLKTMIFVTIKDNLTYLILTDRLKRRRDASYVWIKLYWCNFHFPVSWVICNTNNYNQKNHKYCGMKEQFYGKEGKDPPPKYHGGRFVSNVVKEK